MPGRHFPNIPGTPIGRSLASTGRRTEVVWWTDFEDNGAAIFHPMGDGAVVNANEEWIDV
jgi:hypothetical protein